MGPLRRCGAWALCQGGVRVGSTAGSFHDCAGPGHLCQGAVKVGSSAGAHGPFSKHPGVYTASAALRFMLRTWWHKVKNICSCCGCHCVKCVWWVLITTVLGRRGHWAAAASAASRHGCGRRHARPCHGPHEPRRARPGHGQVCDPGRGRHDAQLRLRGGCGDHSTGVRAVRLRSTGRLFCESGGFIPRSLYRDLYTAICGVQHLFSSWLSAIAVCVSSQHTDARV